MTTHAKHSPSTLDKIRKCLGWISDPTPGQNAMRGTAIHAMIAEYITTADTETPKRPTDDIALRGCDMFDALLQRFPDLEWQVEVKLDPQIHDCYGTADLIGVGAFSSQAVLLDWKTGTGARDNAAESYQVAAYAIGLIRKYKHVDTVLCVVGELEQVATECLFTRKDLEEKSAKITCLVAMADTATPADYTPSEAACRYCGRKAACPALQTSVAETSSKVPATEAGVLALVANMGPEQVAEVLTKYKPQAAMVEMFMEAVENRAKTMIETGQDVPGWKLKEKATARKWTVPDSRVMEICATYEVDPNDLASPAEIEKRLAKKRDKKEAAEILLAISAKGTSKTLVQDGKK